MDGWMDGVSPRGVGNLGHRLSDDPAPIVSAARMVTSAWRQLPYYYYSYCYVHPCQPVLWINPKP
jgi:hypothetical protein